MADIAARALFGGEVVVILWDCRLEHRRTKIWCIVECLGKRVVRQKTEAVRIAAAHIHIARVVPALRRVFEEIDGAYG